MSFIASPFLLTSTTRKHTQELLVSETACAFTMNRHEFEVLSSATLRRLKEACTQVSCPAFLLLHLDQWFVLHQSSFTHHLTSSQALNTTTFFFSASLRVRQALAATGEAATTSTTVVADPCSANHHNSQQHKEETRQLMGCSTILDGIMCSP